MVSIQDTSASPLQIVHRTFDALAALVQDMDVNHRSLDVLVTEKCLNCPDVVARFQELRGEEGRNVCQVAPLVKSAPSPLTYFFQNPSLAWTSPPPFC